MKKLSTKWSSIGSNWFFEWFMSFFYRFHYRRTLSKWWDAQERPQDSITTKSFLIETGLVRENIIIPWLCDSYQECEYFSILLGVEIVGSKNYWATCYISLNQTCLHWFKAIFRLNSGIFRIFELFQGYLEPISWELKVGNILLNFCVDV